MLARLRASNTLRQPRQANLPSGGSSSAGRHAPSMPTSTLRDRHAAAGPRAADQRHGPASTSRRRVYQSGMPGGTSSDFTRMCVIGVRGPSGSER